jgi:hypothetical protein
LASSGKRKTTMAKLNRERRLVERRQEKKAKKDARKRAAALPQGLPGDTLMDEEVELTAEEGEPDGLAVGQPSQTTPIEGKCGGWDSNPHALSGNGF